MKKRPILSKWDSEARYQLPMALLRPLCDMLLRRKNATKYLTVFKHVCRMHSCRPAEPFTLCRRGLAARLGFKPTGVGDIITDLAKSGYIEHHPSYVPSIRVDEDGRVTQKPVIWQFTAWVQSCLAYMLRKNPPKRPPQAANNNPAKYREVDTKVSSSRSTLVNAGLNPDRENHLYVAGFVFSHEIRPSPRPTKRPIPEVEAPGLTAAIAKLGRYIVRD